MISQLLRFIVVGGLNTAVTYLVYCVLVFAVPAQLAWLACYALGTVMGYIAHSRVVFQALGSARSALFYFLLQLAMYILSGCAIWVAMSYFDAGPRLAAASALVLTVPLSFVASRRIFNRAALMDVSVGSALCSRCFSREVL